MNFNVDINTVRSLVTTAGFILFLGIMVWAYRPSRKNDFEEAADLPFANDRESNHE
jgi:cytochrome c oxidase cbb3-type subunit IV